MKSEPNQKTPKDKRDKPLTVIAVHSFNGKPMKEGELKKFVDGALSTAENAADSLHTDEVVAEEEWSN